MMKKIVLIFFGYFIFNLIAAEEVPNFLAGLDQNKTMAFYAIESGLNLSKNDIVQRKAEWAASLPPENRIAFEKFNNLANQAKSQLQNTNTVLNNNNQLSPEANAVKARIQNILNDGTLSRTGEVAAIENILSQNSPSIDAELIDGGGGDSSFLRNNANNVQQQNDQIIQSSIDNNLVNQQQLPRPRQQSQSQKPSFLSLGDLYRASASFAPQRASIFQG
uniref:DUF148 domain-containing protein n=1 Tax=Panagrolaimus superbus TaxID=310955 RepID=A0A914XXM9_9BILA